MIAFIRGRPPVKNISFIPFMLKFLGWVAGIILLLYIAVCLLFYFLQEQFIFYPQKLPADTRFTYPYQFEEYFIEVEEGVKLNGLLFKGQGSEKNTPQRNIKSKDRGLVFYLHGNSGALNTWGYSADEFLAEGYDVFILDYRGFGKSEGKIESQEQLFQDVEKVYQEISKLYQEQKIIITGYSIGTGPASWLAARYQPDMLILIAPFYNLTELAKHHFSFLPSFLLRYPLKNNKYLQEVGAPVVLIHGSEDETIPYESSLKLKEDLGEKVLLFSLEGVGHNNIGNSSQYRRILSEILNE